MAFHANANTELTKILGPLMTAVVKLATTNESIETSEAITRSGSDSLTELKLAGLIGQLRIEDTVKTEFRRLVATPRQTAISRFLRDLVLEAGAGPTIQQALTSSNPALLSIAIQLSFLSFGHEPQSLAQTITQAIEETLTESKNPTNRALDYISVLGVITVCQQQTAAFGWSSFYELVEAKIAQSISEDRNTSHQAKKRRTGTISGLELPANISNRGLPYVILKSLLINLISIQDFPEHRLLQLSTNRGITSIVVLCNYILGLSVKVTCGKTRILFGKEPCHIDVVECEVSRECATLLERLEPDEPLFRFTRSESDPPTVNEYRLEAKGFAKKALLQAGLSLPAIEEYAHNLAANCIEHFDGTYQPVSLGQLNVISMESFIRHNIVSSALFLFDMKEFDGRIELPLKPEGGKGKGKQQTSDRIRWQPFAALVYIFARIRDRASCEQAPLSLTAFRDFTKDDHGLSRSGDTFTGPLPDIILSYELLARLLLGTPHAKELMEKTCLVSAYGWSLFFDSFDAVDPTGLAAGVLHLQLGVPTRLGCPRSRIMDGPTHTDLSSTSGVVINNEDPTLAFWPGVWSSQNTGTYIGNHGRDAFTVVQHFVWAKEEKKSKSWKFGFREKVESCRGWGFLDACSCDDELTMEESQAWIDAFILTQSNPENFPVTKIAVVCKYPASNALLEANDGGKVKKSEDLSPERIFCTESSADNDGVPSSLASGSGDIDRRGALDASKRLGSSPTWFFYVTQAGAARWLALDGLAELNDVADYNYLLRGKDCCIRCAVSQVTTRSLVLL
jgi:hypothetical protein